jgi:hypothetical protein
MDHVKTTQNDIHLLYWWISMFIVVQMYKNSHNYFSLTIHLVRFVVWCVLYNA